MGAYEDVEQQNEFDLLQIVEDLLGGYWETPLSKWEGRRDGVLDLIGKAKRSADDGAMTRISGKKEPFGTTSPTRFCFSSQR